MTQPIQPSAYYLRATNLLTILQNNGPHSQASLAITTAVGNQLPRIEAAVDAGNMVAARGFLETLNDGLADLEVVLNNQGAPSVYIAACASELVAVLRALRDSMHQNAI